MSRRLAEVVVAPATAWGRSALSVLRFSGPDCHQVVGRLVRPLHGPLVVGRPRRVQVMDGARVVDDGVLVLGSGPRTATGEDTAELTVHGNPLIVEQVLALAHRVGARLADPGELTLRAVLHGKLDLVQAEAIGQLVAATSLEGLDVARQALDGPLGAALASLRARLVAAVAELEARLDVPDDLPEAFDAPGLRRELAAIGGEAAALAGTWRAGHTLVEGARVALVGLPNAGKSSLFNALLGRPRALVHALPGTTRDVLELPTTIEGVAVTLLDTAGERVAEDPVEAAGQALAADLVNEADLVIVVLRARPDGPSAGERAILQRTRDRARLVVCNGVDAGGVVPEEALPTVATMGEGVDAVRRALRVALVGSAPASSGLVVASSRQRELLEAVAEACREAEHAWTDAGIAVASDTLMQAVDALDALTGADGRDDVLGALFARFCIGK